MSFQQSPTLDTSTELQPTSDGFLGNIGAPFRNVAEEWYDFMEDSNGDFSLGDDGADRPAGLEA